MSIDPFAGILDPFAFWDIAATYGRYAAFFDLFIYCALFIALAHAVFASRFSGRPGKVMASVVGIALGVSLVLVEQQFGWTLAKASPFAALIALFLVGFLMLQTMVRIQIPWTLAVPLTYVIIYLFLRAISPEMMKVISDRIPFIHLLTAVMFLICIWRIGVAIWPTGISVSRHEGDARFVATMDRDTEKREFRLVKKLKRELAPQAVNETAHLERNLDSVRKELNREAPRWDQIAQIASHVAHEGDEVIQIVDRIRVLDGRIKRFDLRDLGQLNAYYQQLSDQDRERLKSQIILERQKIIEESAIEQLADGCEQRHQEFRRLMDVMGEAAYRHDRQAGLEAIAQAITVEEQQRRDMRRLQRAEKMLLAVTKRKLGEEKHV